MKVTSESALRDIYGLPAGRSKLKQLNALEQHSRQFIAMSPFLVISTANKSGLLDASPRGGAAGFVKVVDDNCIVIPDAKGNKRLDSLVNIIQSGQIGCLFLIPGVDETLRVNGRASINIDNKYLSIFQDERHPPQSVIVIEVTEVFLHCAKALMRSKLWSSDSQIERQSLPTMGKMINDQIGESAAPEPQEQMIKRYLKDL